MVAAPFRRFVLNLESGDRVLIARGFWAADSRGDEEDRHEQPGRRLRKPHRDRREPDQDEPQQAPNNDWPERRAAGERSNPERDERREVVEPRHCC